MTRPIRLATILTLVVGMAGMQLAARPAVAATTITVSTCDQSHLDAAVQQANNDNAGDTITFSCSGTITLSSTLTINGSMTIDGSGQSVILDGGGSVQLPTFSPKERGFDALTGRGAGPHKRHVRGDGRDATGPVAPRPHVA